MKIYELPQQIQNRVFQLQIEAGNKPNDQLDLIAKKHQGNFNWHDSSEDYPFWIIVNSGYFDSFNKMYPDGVKDPRINKAELAKQITENVIRECSFYLSDHNWEELQAVLLKNLEALPL